MPASWQTCFLQFIHVCGTIAVDIFILITGYFSVGRKQHWKKIVLLVGEMYFYSILIYAVGSGTGIIDFSVKDAIKSLLLTVYGNWYVVYYLLFCFLQPFINKIIGELSQGEYKRILTIITGIYFTLAIFLHGWTFDNLTLFISLYLLGGYISLYGVNELKWKKAGTTAIVFIAVSVPLLVAVGRELGIEKLLSRVSFFDNNHYLPVVLAATGIFISVKNRKIASQPINYLAKSVIGVYLIHDNEYLRNFLWGTWWPNKDFISSYFLPIHAFSKMVIIFAVCLIIDIVRRETVNQVCSKWLTKHWSTIYKITNSIIKRFEKIYG